VKGKRHCLGADKEDAERQWHETMSWPEPVPAAAGPAGHSGTKLPGETMSASLVGRTTPQQLLDMAAGRPTQLSLVPQDSLNTIVLNGYNSATCRGEQCEPNPPGANASIE